MLYDVTSKESITFTPRTLRNSRFFTCQWICTRLYGITSPEDILMLYISWQPWWWWRTALTWKTRFTWENNIKMNVQEIMLESVVGIATSYGLDGPGIESRWGRDFPHYSMPALRPTQPPLQWVPHFFAEGKGPGRDADYSLPSSHEVRERVELHLCSPSWPSWPALRWTLQCLWEGVDWIHLAQDKIR
jgi:hypothetical protein